jgi:hypothetical protein
MAKIVPSQEAPNEKIRYGLANESFDLTASGSYETDDQEVIANANSHPWLDVKYDKSEEAKPAFRPGTIDPKDDALSAANSIAFDPKEVTAAREAALAVEEDRTAIEAGLDQDKKVEDEGVAFTLAADEAQEAKS